MSPDPSPTRSRNLLPWAIAAIAVAALVVSLAWDRGAAPEPVADEVTGQADAGDSPAENEGRAPVARPVGAAPGGGAGRIEGGSFGGGDGEPQSPDEIAAARDRQLRELEAQFARDVPDPAGAARVEGVLVDTISGSIMAGTGLSPQSVDIACKQSSCRVVGNFERMGDAQDWSLFYITAVGGNVLSQSQMVFIPTSGGTEVRIYSTRAND